MDRSTTALNDPHFRSLPVEVQREILEHIATQETGSTVPTSEASGMEMLKHAAPMVAGAGAYGLTALTPFRSLAPEAATLASEGTRYLTEGPEAVKAAAPQSILSTLATHIPGGPMVQALAQAGANIGGMKTSEMLGTQKPSGADYAMGVAIPAAGGLIGTVADKFARGTRMLLPSEGPEVAAAAKLAAAKAQEEAETAFEARKLLHGQQDLQTAKIGVQGLEGRTPAGQIYEQLGKNESRVPLTNYRGAQENLQDVLSIERRLDGLPPSSPLQKLAQVPTAPAGEEVTLGRIGQLAAPDFNEFIKYKEQGGQGNIKDFRTFKEQLTAHEQALGGESAPVSAIMARMQKLNRLLGRATKAGDGEAVGALRDHIAALSDDLQSAPEVAHDFRQAQATYRRQMGEQDLNDALRTSTRQSALPGEPYTDILDTKAAIGKLKRLRQDRLFEGSFPPGYLDNYEKMLREMHVSEPQKPSKVYGLGEGEQPQAKGAVHVITPQNIGSLLGGAAGATLASHLGIPHPFILGGGAGHMVGKELTGTLLGAIANSPGLQRLTKAIMQGGENRVSTGSLQGLARLLEMERQGQALPPETTVETR